MLFRSKWSIVKNTDGDYQIKIDLLTGGDYYKWEHYWIGSENNQRRYDYHSFFASDDFSNAEIAVKLDVVAR